MLVGSPPSVARFGFSPHAMLIMAGIPAACFLVLPFIDQIPEGIGEFHPAFLVP